MFGVIAATIMKRTWDKVWAEGYTAGYETAQSKVVAELKAADPSHPLYQWNNPAFRLGYEYAMGVVQGEEK